MSGLQLKIKDPLKLEKILRAINKMGDPRWTFRNSPLSNLPKVVLID